jgi:ATP-binding cassette subfamily B protein
LLRRFLSYYKPHRSLLILDLSAAVLSAGLSVLLPYLTRGLLKVHIPARDLYSIIRTLLLMAAMIMLLIVMRFIRVRWGHILGVRMEYDMRDDIFRHIQKLSFTYFDNTKTGHIMSRISNDLNMIAEVAHHAPEDLLISFSIIMGAFAFMFFFNVSLALLTFIPLPLMLAWGWSYGQRMKEGFRQVRRRIADINSTVENSVQGIREVKSYAQEELEIAKFTSSNTSFKKAKERMYALMSYFFSGMQFLREFYYLTVIAGGVWLIYRGKIEGPDLLAFILYVSIILPPIDRLVNFIEQFQQGTASFERFIEIMQIEPDIQDKRGAYSLDRVDGEISIQNMSFRYTSSSDWVVKDIDLHIESGQKVAIVGESGAGKSTIVSLIPRFYECQRGVISIDGHNVHDLKQRFLRENIGLVQQNVFLFDGTIRENIMYGNPDATNEQLIQAAEMANIASFIRSLPDGFDTEVGERGVKLSGGQKQRISIARVFLKDPPILIFDEATSSLDSESENLIQDAMLKLSENRTTIIIAHRLSTVRHVDKIYVVKEGRVVETGRHEELIENGGYYHSLYSLNLF